MISDERYEKFLEKKKAIKEEEARLESIRIKPGKEVDEYLEKHGDRALKDGVLASDFLRRPYVTYADLLHFIPAPEKTLDRHVIEQIEIQYKYSGYIKKEYEQIEKLKRMEAMQKLTKIQPETLAQASRISGVNPADLAILAVYIEQGKIAKVD